MKKNLLLIMLLLAVGILNAQNVWTQMATYSGVLRQDATGFAIGSKGYIGLGLNYENNAIKADFWSYNPSTNTWTQEADYGGTGRFASSCFVVGNNAYVGLGSDTYPGYDFKSDFWKYDATANTWSSIASFPGTARYAASGFSVGTKGFIGLGWDQATYFSDFWEYDSNTNSWSQKTDYPGGGITAGIGFSIGSNGYLGGGIDVNNTVYNTFYKYDTTTNAWTAIANSPSIISVSTSFIVNNKAYVGTGTTTYPGLTPFNHWWMYNPTSNTWTAIADMGGTIRAGAVAFAIDSVGYCGTGAYNGYASDLNDFWKYAPLDIGINEVTLSDINISVYPNPSNGQFKLTYTASKNISLETRIIDIEGKVLFFQNQKQIVGNNEFSFDLSNLAKGMYFVELTFEGNSVSKKVIFQ